MTPEEKMLDCAKARTYHRVRRDILRAKQQKEPTRSRVEQTMLYIMSIDEIPGLYKVGRTSNVANRRNQLNAAHCFNVRVVSQYPGHGQYEVQIHDLLSPYRMKSEGSKCREWYKTTVEHIHNTIQSVVNSNSASSSSTPAGVPSTNLNHPEESDEEDA